LDLGIKAPRLLEIRVILQPGPHEITEKKKIEKTAIFMAAFEHYPLDFNSRPLYTQHSAK
jgi:hypothetical protein